MVRKLVWVLVAIPVGVVLVLFAVANRGPVTLVFDPFVGPDTAPAFTLTLPLYLVLFGVLALGVLVGGAASWLKHRRVRSSARRARAEAERATGELARIRRGEDDARPVARAPALPAARSA